MYVLYGFRTLLRVDLAKLFSLSHAHRPERYSPMATNLTRGMMLISAYSLFFRLR
jgi:hypothetical protein